jgi:hypothetical protein
MYNVAAVVIYHSAQIIPAPPQDFEVSEIGLPHFMNKIGFVFELIGC